MKRWITIFLGILLVCGLLWTALMGYINSRSSELNVTVSGDVDQVTFYEANAPDTEVARVVTNGTATQQTLSLRNTVDYSFWRQMPPAAYHLVIHQNGRTRDAGSVCCPVGLRSATIHLDVRGLDQWERTSE